MEMGRKVQVGKKYASEVARATGVTTLSPRFKSPCMQIWVLAIYKNHRRDFPYNISLLKK
jgi:hypothetical protein